MGCRDIGCGNEQNDGNISSKDALDDAKHAVDDADGREGEQITSL